MKQLLIVVDYQNDFVDGSLGFAGAELLDSRIVKKITACRNAGGDVVFTMDTHTDAYLQTQEGRNLPVPHCLAGSPGWELYGDTKRHRQAGDLVFEKNTFGSLKLAQWLSRQRYGRIDLVGLVSNLCVTANAVLAKSALPEAEIVVDSSCTASHDPALHQAALDVLRGLQIVVQ